MIDEKKITEAVNAYIGFPKEIGEGLETSMRRDAFRDGAKWFIKAIWHDAEEEPKSNKKLVVQRINCKGYIYYEIDKNRTYVSWKGYGINKWCYLEDILPKGGEE